MAKGKGKIMHACVYHSTAVDLQQLMSAKGELCSASSAVHSNRSRSAGTLVL